MRFGSVCSGIEAASVAWHPLDWETAFLSEIEAFPRSVLAHHYPGTPLHGDFTTIGADDYGPIDLLVGGTPCQSFSIAGLRGGLGDDRGNLALEFLRLADRKRPRWLVWENVPGVLSSNGGRDFGAILGGLVKLGYGFAYRVLDAQYVRVDSHPRAGPQRRRRVFVVGHSGGWHRAAAVLFEREGLQGHPAPRREAGQGVAGGAAHSLRGSDFDASEDGTGRGTPIVPTDWPASVASTLNAAYGDKMGLEDQHALTGASLFVPAAFNCKGSQVQTALAFNHQSGGDFRPMISEECANALQRHQGQAVAIQERAAAENPAQGPGGKGWRDDGASYTLEARTNVQSVATSHAVRRLTPTECERLQGFPDGYTLVPHRGKPAADGPRYKALGNSMAVNVMSWIGQRIQMVDRL